MSRRLEPADPALLVPPRARLLHVGPPKTGTTALQRAAAAQRAELRRQGVLYPGKGHNHRRAAFRFAGRTEGWGTAAAGDRAVWDALVAQVHAERERRVWLSSESLAELEPPLIDRLLQEVGGEVHVVMTLRSLPALLASAWSQYLKTGLRVDVERWAQGVLADPPARDLTPSFRRRTDLPALVGRWQEAVGPDRLTVVVLDPDDHGLVPRTFESLLGLVPGTLTDVPLRRDQSNRSFTSAEAELVRRLNARVRSGSGAAWADYERYVRNSTVPALLRRDPRPDEPRIAPPRWAVERLAALAAEQARALDAMDLRVVGDLARLARPTSAVDDAPAPVSGIPVGAVLAGLSACLDARMAAERAAADGSAVPGPGGLDEVGGRVLVRGLADRVVRGVRRQVLRRWPAARA